MCGGADTADALSLLSAGHEIVHLSTYPREIRSEADKHRCGHTFTFPHQTQEYVLRSRYSCG